MMGAYELWEMRSGNLVQSWAAEADALAVIRTALDAHGDAAVSTMSLLAERCARYHESHRRGASIG